MKIIGAIDKGRREPTNLGLNIKWHMAKRQLKAEVLAKLAGIGDNTLSRMCFTGGPSPTLANIEKVAQVLDVESWELLIRPEERE